MEAVYQTGELFSRPCQVMETMVSHNRPSSMHVGRFCKAMCIGKEALYIVEGYIAKELLHITDAWEVPRVEANLREDVLSFTRTHCEDNEWFSLVGEFDTFVSVTHLNLNRVNPMSIINMNLEDLIDWPKDSYNYDYITRRTGIPNQDILYLVALPLAELEEVAKGLVTPNLNIKVFDYWPVTNTYVYERRNGLILGTVKDDYIILSVWWKCVCLKRMHVDKTAKALVDGLEKLKEKLCELGVSEIQGVTFYGLDKADSDLALDIAAIQDEYRGVERAPFIIDDPIVRERVKVGHMHWDAAIGLLMRTLAYISINE